MGHKKIKIDSTPINDYDKRKYVSTALALLLKKNGFNHKCTTKISLSTRALTDTSFAYDWNKSKRFVSAPLLQDVVDWITDYFEIVINPLWIKPKDEQFGYFGWVIYDSTKPTDSDDDDAVFECSRKQCLDRYEALEDALTVLFDNYGDTFGEVLIEDEISTMNETSDEELTADLLPHKNFAYVEL